MMSDALSEWERRVAADPTDHALRFGYAVEAFECGLLQEAIKHFQKTVQVREFELASYSYLGRAFVQDPRFGLDMAILQFRKGLESRGHATEDYLALRYDLALMLVGSGRLHEALRELKQIVAVDVDFRDAMELLRRIAGGFFDDPGPPGAAAVLGLPPHPTVRAIGRRLDSAG